MGVFIQFVLTIELIIERFTNGTCYIKYVRLASTNHVYIVDLSMLMSD